MEYLPGVVSGKWTPSSSQHGAATPRSTKLTMSTSTNQDLVLFIS